MQVIKKFINDLSNFLYSFFYDSSFFRASALWDSHRLHYYLGTHIIKIIVIFSFFSISYIFIKLSIKLLAYMLKKTKQ